MADFIQQLKDNAGVIAIVAGIIVELIRRHKSKTDTLKASAEVDSLRQEVETHKEQQKQLAVETAMQVLEMKNKENEQLSQRITVNEGIIVRLKADNENCEFEHKLTRMQLRKVLNKLDMLHWTKATVFLLDDNETVTQVFAHWVRRLPVVDFKTFTNVDQFIDETNREKPEIVIIDFDLGHEITANDVRKRITHKPEIFIISGTKERHKDFEGTSIRFFYKDESYLRNISEAIIEVLDDKNKHI